MGCRWRERRQDAMRLTPVRAYMDDITLVTTTVPWMRRILESMKIKPIKSRRISISRGKLSDRKFVIDEEKIPIIREKAVKSLGRRYQ